MEMDAMISKFHAENSEALKIENINYELENVMKKMQKLYECMKNLKDKRGDINVSWGEYSKSEISFLISMARKQIHLAKITMLDLRSCQTRPTPVLRNQNHLRVNRSNGTSGANAFARSVLRNPKFDNPTDETGSALVRKSNKLSIKFWSRANFESTTKSLHTVNGNGNKSNVRWNGQSGRIKISKSGPTAVKRLIEPLNSQEDIFFDLSKNDSGDDKEEDGFTSSSEDCISLSVLLEE
nr:hypothetical transcript [Hymenolepis microstoma]